MPLVTRSWGNSCGETRGLADAHPCRFRPPHRPQIRLDANCREVVFALSSTGGRHASLTDFPAAGMSIEKARQMFSSTAEGRIRAAMIGRLGHLSNTCLLLAATLLPVQQSLMVACCCQRGREATRCPISDLQPPDGLLVPSECCNGLSPNGGCCCCSGGECDSESNPCHCPVGCCGKLGPSPAVADTAGSSLTFELFGGTVASVGAEPKAFSAAQPHVTLGGPFSPGKASLCARLCRYLL